MESVRLMHLTIGWWNTSLSPRGKPRLGGHEENLVLALIVIKNMLVEKELDFLALGEVCRDDFIEISLLLKNTSYEIQICDSKVGGSVFSQAYIYNSQKIGILTSTLLTWEIVDRKYRVGHALKIAIVDGSQFILIVSHWPSKMPGDADKIRPHLGARLRDYFNDIRASETDIPHMILMGDYNSEPFEAPLSEYLIATRDKERVRKKSDLFYNPYWKNLGMSTCDRYCGSSYYKSGLYSNWSLFDQILFSSAFVNGNFWKLDEDGVTLGIESALELVSNSKLVFDHLPVFARLEKINE
ncbi:hypothetical protein M2404_003440 [Rheinheimera pacifica]|uniref:endonuclease/exonuclease/phosphatase family protein n=1 Tax=Rheinheimera pacifica TaxID=173990 RepID=UPI00216A6C40|nr:endonuclease/exonuclease/phosphatase family protein [Rheinheimera pacifica]MCS4309077.1 hypothetical protein [Rheinheimera pacifica]